MTADVVMYRTPYCPYCVLAKRLLSKKGVAFREVDVSGDFAKRGWLHEVTGRHTVPQVFVDGQPVGGWLELHRLDRAGKLDALLRGE
jgi:glutaredoxin 3